MRELKLDDTNLLKNDQLILMTLKNISQNAPFFVADFNDIQAPVFIKTGNYIGWSVDGILKFGKGPAKMMNGTWIIEEDKNISEEYTNLKIDPILIEMVIIK